MGACALFQWMFGSSVSCERNTSRGGKKYRRGGCVNFPKPILANTAVTRSNICFTTREWRHGSQPHQEIPRLRFAPLGMTRGEMRQWPQRKREQTTEGRA